MVEYRDDIDADEAEEMENQELENEPLHFTLHLDKSLPCPVEKAAWNPEKDLLAMVTTDHQLTVHRFNWQRLWSISPEKKVTSICWRPDGKALAVGHEDGYVTLYDVENGDVMRKIATHKAAIVCLYWVEERQLLQASGDILMHEDRTPRFFPPPPKGPPMPGAGATFDLVGALAPMEDLENSNRKATSRNFQQNLSILCSGDKDGIICLNAFGVFPIGRLDLRSVQPTLECQNTKANEQSLSAHKILLSSDLQQMTLLLCNLPKTGSISDGNLRLSAVSVDTSLIGRRHKEIRQVALQASNIEELLDVVQNSMDAMRKCWCDAIGSFDEKFGTFSMLLREHGSHSSPQAELLSLLSCGSASPALHQFLAASLGEGGLKRMGKSIDAAGKELLNIISEHLQPAAEIISFRLGELCGLSRWGSRLRTIGLDEKLMDQAMEDAGMVLIQIERFLHIVSDTIGQFRLFFLWLTKSLRQLNGEPLVQADQLPPINSAAIAAFLRSQFEKDFVAPHFIKDGLCLDIDQEEEIRIEELAIMGGFKDLKFLQRTLQQQIQQLHGSCSQAFSMPVKAVSPTLCIESRIMLCQNLDMSSDHMHLPLSLLYYGDVQTENAEEKLEDYICFKVNSDACCIGLIRHFGSSSGKLHQAEVVTLRLDGRFACIDLALYKQRQLILLLGERRHYEENTRAWIMLLQLQNRPFALVSTEADTGNFDFLEFCLSHGAVEEIDFNNGKRRAILQMDVIPPIAVSVSRGLACVFAGQRRALLYDLEEDEDEKEDAMA